MNNKVLKFRKKPVVIDAVKWTGANLREIITFTSGAPDVSTAVASAKWADYCDLVNSKGLIIKTLEGEHIATVGDWIIKGVKGECYPCKPDIFELTYEVATPAPIPNADHSEDVRAMVVPDGWLVEKMADNGVSGFIVRTPRAEGVRTCTAVFPDDDDPAHRLLAMLLASPAAKGGDV